MKFTLEQAGLVKMVKQVGKKMPGQKRIDPTLRLFACKARVFVESNQTVAGMEALVLEDGDCTLPRVQFLEILQTYRGKKHLTLDVDTHGLRIGSFSMPVSRYSAQVEAPGKFQVFPVTDLKALFPNKHHLSLNSCRRNGARGTLGEKNLLVRLQNPSCHFYATERDWQRRFGRNIKEDARPMLILAPMHPVMCVYDLDSTEGPPLPEHLQNFASTSGDWDCGALERLIENANRDRIKVDFAKLSSSRAGFATSNVRGNEWKMRVVIHEPLDGTSRFATLCHELDRVP